MKVSAFLGILLFVGCSHNDTLVGIIPAPNSTSTAGGAKFALAPYQDMLDTLYYKVWSDSSWTAYGGTKVIGTGTYTVIKDNAGDEYYYNSQGYAGFYNPGATIVMFDTPLGAWPDSLPINGQINESTTFAYQGYTWTLYNTYNLADTTSASAAFGTFDPCLHIQFVSTFYVAGSGNSTYEDFWLANGPGEIVQEDEYGVTTVMVRGQVNGKYWGAAAAKAMPARSLSKSEPRDLQRALLAGLPVRMQRFESSRLGVRVRRNP